MAPETLSREGKVSGCIKLHKLFGTDLKPGRLL